MALETARMRCASVLWRPFVRPFVARILHKIGGGSGVQVNRRISSEKTACGLVRRKAPKPIPAVDKEPEVRRIECKECVGKKLYD